MLSIILGMKFLILLGLEGKVFSKSENLIFPKLVALYVFEQKIWKPQVLFGM